MPNRVDVLPLASTAPRRRRRGRAQLLFGLCCALVLLSSAGLAGKPPSARAEATQAAKAATKALVKGEWAKAADQLQVALGISRRAAPLQVTAVAVTRTRPTGFGAFEPAPGNVVEGRDVMLYVQLAGVHHRALAGGRFERDLAVSASFTYQDPDDGPIPLGDKTLGEQRLQVRAVTAAAEAFIGLDVNLSEKAPAGRYDLVLKVEDRVAERGATAPATFVLK